MYENYKEQGTTTIEPKKAAYWGEGADTDGVSDLKDRQGNGVADFNDLPKESIGTQDQEPEKVDADYFLQKMYEQPPKPVFDTENADYQKRAARLSAIAEGAAALSDVFGVAIGGNARNPEKNTKVPEYIQRYFKAKDDYNQRLDNWQNRDWANRMNIYQARANQANVDKNYDFREKQWGENVDRWQKTFDNSNDKWQQQFDKQGEQWQDQFDKQGEQYNRSQSFREELPFLNAWLAEQQRDKDYEDYVKKLSAKVQLDRAGKGYTVFNSNRQPIGFVADDGELQKLFTVISNDPALQENVKNRLKLLKPNLGEGVTKDHMKVIVSEFAEQSPAAAKYFQGSVPQNTKTKVPSFTPPNYLPSNTPQNNQGVPYRVGSEPTQTPTPTEQTDPLDKYLQEYEVQ